MGDMNPSKWLTVPQYDVLLNQISQAIASHSHISEDRAKREAAMFLAKVEELSNSSESFVERVQQKLAQITELTHKREQQKVTQSSQSIYMSEDEANGLILWFEKSRAKLSLVFSQFQTRLEIDPGYGLKYPPLLNLQPILPRLLAASEGGILLDRTFVFDIKVVRNAMTELMRLKQQSARGLNDSGSSIASGQSNFEDHSTSMASVAETTVLPFSEEYWYFVLHNLVGLTDAVLMAETDKSKVVILDRMENCCDALQQYLKETKRAIEKDVALRERIETINSLLFKQNFVKRLREEHHISAAGDTRNSDQELQVEQSQHSLTTSSIYAILCDQKQNQWHRLQRTLQEQNASLSETTQPDATTANAGGNAATTADSTTGTKGATAEIDMDRMRKRRRLLVVTNDVAGSSLPASSTKPTGSGSGSGTTEPININSNPLSTSSTKFLQMLQLQRNIDEDLSPVQRDELFLNRSQSLEQEFDSFPWEDIIEMNNFAGMAILRSTS